MEAMMRVWLWVMLWAVCCCLAGPAKAADLGEMGRPVPSADMARSLRVGVVVAPPFIIKIADGHFSGISFDLWRDVAHDLGLGWQVTEYSLTGLLEAVRTGAVDVGVTDLSITPEREEVMDFSQAYYSTGLGIAVAAKSSGAGLLAALTRVVSVTVLEYAGSLLCLLLVTGTVMWFLERRRNPGNFHPGRRGIGDGLWWSAVTMTSVGYGDTTPRTPLGRAVALVWMFASVALLAFFTAGITTSLTLEGLGGTVRGPEDLYKVRTGVKRGSSAEESLVASHVGICRFDDVEEGLRAVLSGEIDAFVHDRPVLGYLQHLRYVGQLRILPPSFDPQLYGFAFPPKSNLRKSVNVAMLRRLEDRVYRMRLFGPYLGKDEAR
jgi:polar amino acid transport system substrate-binding protein